MIESSNIKAVIFDLDGTLVKFGLDVVNIRREAIEVIRKHDVYVDNLGSLNMYLIIEVLQKYTDACTLSSLKNILWGIVEKYELKAAEEVVLQPNVLNILESLKNSGLKLAIVTNNGQKATKKVLEKCGLLHLFTEVITRDDVDKLKPDGESIEKALKNMEIVADNAIYVGDSEMDIVATKNARVTSVSVPSGISTIPNLIKAEPDYILNSLDSLPNLFNISI